jgi:two-component system, OmpR family, response regulator
MNPPAAAARARHLLIVDDDDRIRELLKEYLARAGFRVTAAAGGAPARKLIGSLDFDLAVFDVMMPGEDGFSLTRWLREQKGPAGKTPVLMLTAMAESGSRIEGLKLGADDYLAKPFSVLELVARVRALLRRTDALARNARLEAGRLEHGNLSIDPLAREVQVDGKPIELTPREFDLLHFFARHPGRVFSRLDLLNQVWGYQHDGYEHTVNTHINRLRMKVEADPAQPSRILTVWGRGYKLATLEPEQS